MRSIVEVSRSSILDNYRFFKSHVRQGAVVSPVLKSNAYGHGLDLVYNILMTESPPSLCVNYVAEGERLREKGYKGQIIIVGPIEDQHLALCASNSLEPFIGGDDLLSAWLALKERPKIHLKVDTGMGRQGFRPERLKDITPKLKDAAQDIAGVCSHFANVEDVTRQAYAENQVTLLTQAASLFAREGIKAPLHIASSASSLIMPSSHLDLVRVGISLYGFWPSDLTRVSYGQVHGELANLKPALAWRTQIASLKTVPRDTMIGYGCTFRTLRETLIAVLPVGYAEGYPRLCSNHSSYVLIKGRPCPIIGRICMNMMMVDVSEIRDQVKPGDSVSLIGSDGDETITAEQVASWAETIQYELVTRILSDIPRVEVP